MEEEEKQPSLITSVETFKKAFDRVVEDVSKFFLDQGSAEHLVIVIDKEGCGHPVRFDVLGRQVQKETGSNNIGAVKSHVYRAIGLGMALQGMVGYIEISEVWMIEASKSDYGDLIKRHGKDLGDVPGRTEAIVVCGRYRDHSRMIQRKIRRLGDIAALGEILSFDGYVPGDGRQMFLWEAIDSVTGSDLAKRSKKEVRGVDGETRPGPIPPSRRF